MSTLLTSTFPEQDETEAFGASQPRQKWAVTVTAGSGRVPSLRLTVLVEARTSDGAIRTARANIYQPVPRNARYLARLATASDLGCRPLPAWGTTAGGYRYRSEA